MHDDDSEFDSPLRGAADKGLLVNKTELGKITGLAQVTIDRAIASGAPVEGKGSRKAGWQINTAKFFAWYWRYKVEDATGDPDVATFDAAKRREKEAQAKLKELQYQRETGKLIPVERAVAIYQEDAGQQRSRLLAIPASIAQDLAHEDDPAEIEAKITDALNDALGDISGDKIDSYLDEPSEGTEYADESSSEDSPENDVRSDDPEDDDGDSQPDPDFG